MFARLCRVLVSRQTVLRLPISVAAAVTLLVSGAPQAGAHGVSAPKTWNIVLSNNYMGNEWRPQMVNDAKVVAKKLGHVNLKIVISAATPSGQIASLQSIITSKPDAILIDSASATALNPTLERACREGILVFTFDQVATAPCAYKLKEDYTGDAKYMGHWMAETLHGHGQIFMDTGLAGIPISEAFVAGWNNLFKSKYPHIKVAGTYSSEYAPGPEEQAISSLLVQHPNISGVLSGSYCTSVIKAFQAAGRKLVPMTCLAANGNMVQCVKLKVPCFFFSAPTWVSGEAVQWAVNLLRHTKSYPKTAFFYRKNYATNKAKLPNTGPVEPVKFGKNAFPKLSPALLIPVSFGKFHLTPHNALNGS